MPKYNLALVPVSISDDVIRCAKQFSKFADSYLLGKNSLPHVTLYQFEAEEKEIAKLWKRVSDYWKEQPIKLTFKDFSCISFDEIIFWASLLPDDFSNLYRMHGIISKMINQPIKKTYDPHMTLFNTKNKEYEGAVKILESAYQPLSDKFVLSLGKSDEVGQLTEIIFSADGV